MLAYVLALAVGLGSIAIYLAAFFFPEIHRKNDFILSGVGLFYALVLWVFAQRITGGLLLGHVASVALLYWFGWEALSLRQQLTPKVQQTPIPSAETVKTTIQKQVTKLSLPARLAQLQKGIGNTFTGVKYRVQQTVSRKTPATPKHTDKSPVEIIDERTSIPQQPTESKTESVLEAIPPHLASPYLPRPSTQSEKGSEETPPPVTEKADVAQLPLSTEAPSEQMPPNPT